jgi:hypothetical protein
VGDRVDHFDRDDGEHRHYSIDSTTIRADVAAAGVKGYSSTGSWPLAGRFGCKVHCIADADRRPLVPSDRGQAADCKAYDTLIALPKAEPAALVRRRHGLASTFALVALPASIGEDARVRGARRSAKFAEYCSRWPQRDRKRVLNVLEPDRQLS